MGFLAFGRASEPMLRGLLMPTETIAVPGRWRAGEEVAFLSSFVLKAWALLLSSAFLVRPRPRRGELDASWSAGTGFMDWLLGEVGVLFASPDELEAGLPLGKKL